MFYLLQETHTPVKNVFHIIQYYTVDCQQYTVGLERRLYPHNRRFMERSDARLHRPYGETTKQK